MDMHRPLCTGSRMNLKLKKHSHLWVDFGRLVIGNGHRLCVNNNVHRLGSVSGLTNIDTKDKGNIASKTSNTGRRLRRH